MLAVEQSAPEKQRTKRAATLAMPVAPVLQRKCACGGTATGTEGECQQCKKKKLQRRAEDFRELNTAPPIVEEVLESSGLPLAKDVRSFMEPRFGHDFSKVRVHTDPKAAESARAVKALAYTVGSNVVFAHGQYAPGKPAGRKLLAHELTHVVQQRKARNAAPQAKLEVGPAHDSQEQEADRFAEQVAGVSDAASTPPPKPPSESKPRVQRAVNEQPPTATSTAPPAAAPIVDDEAQQIGPGQMRKTEFLDRLRTHVCSVADTVLASVGRTAQGCPVIERWIGHLREKNVQYIERGLRKYASPAAHASAQDFIHAVGEKVREGVTRWTTTGEISGVPPELMSEMMGGGVLGALAGMVSGIAGAIGGAISGIGKLFTKEQPGGSRAGNPAVIQAQLGSFSVPLESGVRTRMEAAFGHSFSGVRVHADARAAMLSSGLNARAFTIGNDVAFAAGEYSPGTLIGDALIAHELAHVIQQDGGAGRPGPMTGDLAQHNRLEEDADWSAVGAMVSLWSGTRVSLQEIGTNALPRLRSGLRLQRCSSACDQGDRESMTKINLCCTDDMTKKEIKPTLAKALSQVDGALSKLKASPKSMEGPLKNNFAVLPDDAESVARITGMLDLISKEMKSNREKFVCRDTRDQQCKADRPGFRKYAETIPGVKGNEIYIKLCANYEMAGFYHGTFLVGGNWVKTFVHEYAHAANLANASNKGFTIAPKNAEFYKEGDPYPQEKEKNLGNADCYAWFVNDAASAPAAPATPAGAGGASQSKFTSMTPWQISQLPDSEFKATSGDASAKQQLADYERTRQLALKVYKEYGIKFDIDQDKTRQVGRDPSKDELVVLDKQLSAILALPGVQKSLQAPGTRKLATADKSKKPTLQGGVKIATNPGEYGIKRYQLELAITSGFGKDTSMIDGEVGRLWQRYKVPAGNPTDQERRLAMFVFFADNPFVPGFYSPLDDTIHLSHFVDLKKPHDVEVARHETLHFLGGRDKTRKAFVARYGEADYIPHWCIFEEGTAQVLTLESAPPAEKKPAGSKPAPAKPAPPAKTGETTVEVEMGAAYEGEVKVMKGVMQTLGREVVLNAYFTGEIPAKLFEILDKTPKTECGKK